MKNSSFKYLVIVESPSKARTISKILGRDYRVIATLGHIVDLPKRKLGVNPENGFIVEYNVLYGKKKIIDEIKRLAKKAEIVYLATDPDREGEIISYHILKYSKIEEDKYWRIHIKEITPQGIKEALENKTKIDLNKVASQQTRRILDRLIGYKISPILWRKLSQKGLSAGRVQTVGLRIIYEREKEIEEFKSKEFYKIFLDAVIDNVKITLPIELEKGRYLNKIEAEELKEKLEEKIKNKEFFFNYYVKLRKEAPPEFFITSTLQKEAGNLFKFSPGKTMRIAQTLYEGKNLGTTYRIGLITYMRTDSKRISSSAINMAKNFVEKNYPNIKKDNINFNMKNSKFSQDAHEAIRPSNVEYTPYNIKRYLTQDEYKLYDLIWRRFISNFLKDAVYEDLFIEISFNKIEDSPLVFKKKLSRIKEKNFREVYYFRMPKDDEFPFDFSNIKIEKLYLKKERTKPPSRYTISSFISILEKNGIGRPSTYAQIIETLKKRGYIKIKGTTIYITELGKKLWEFFKDKKLDLFDIEFTKNMEDDLDKIENKKKERNKVLSDFYNNFKNTLEFLWKGN